MLVKFKVNLGSLDAERQRLDFRKCVKGAEVECSDDAAAWLVAKGIATAVVAVAKPAAIQAVPPARFETKNKHKDS